MSDSCTRMLRLADRYLAHRRRFGFNLKIEGGLVRDFARFADRIAGGQPLTITLALAWATLPSGSTPLYHAKRLEALRGFARYCAALDSRVEVPPGRMLGPAHRRIAPHIYSPGQIALLLRRAGALPPTGSLRPRTFVTFIGLLASTGLRVIEARRLRPEDFDAEAGTLRIARTKFSPERVLPLHPSTVCALMRYQDARHRRWPSAQSFFVGTHGLPLSNAAMYSAFRELTHDMVGNGARTRPRLYDLRHTFATRMIARWSRSAAPIAHHLLLLSRYLGHQTFLATYWYVSADPAAMTSVAIQFQRYWRGQPKVTHEPDVVPIAATAVLRRTPPRTTSAQPPNDRRIPRHLPTAAAISLRPPPLSC